jgi:integrase/recombinase XerD
MTSVSSDRPVSALRARMIEDMKVRGFGEKTRNDYIGNAAQGRADRGSQ